MPTPKFKSSVRTVTRDRLQGLEDYCAGNLDGDLTVTCAELRRIVVELMERRDYNTQTKYVRSKIARYYAARNRS